MTWWKQWRGTVLAGVVVLGITSGIAVASVHTMASVQHSNKPAAIGTLKPAAPTTAKAQPTPKTTTGRLQPSPVGRDGYYTVTPWDIDLRAGALSFIAARFGTSVAQLVAWNHIADPNVISVGQRLRVR